MPPMKTLVLLGCLVGLLPSMFAQTKAPQSISAAEAKNHIDQMATVCGKVVDSKIPKYGIAGYGKPVTFDLDQPAPNPVFYFVAFGAKPGGPQEVVAAYQGKRVCVTGKIDGSPTGPFILAADRSQIKPQPETK